MAVATHVRASMSLAISFLLDSFRNKIHYRYKKVALVQLTFTDMSINHLNGYCISKAT